MKRIDLYVDEELFEKANSIMDSIGMDIDTIVRVLLKRLVKEKNMVFLFNQNIETLNSTAAMQVDIDINKEGLDTNKMTKNKAIRLFKSEGIEFNETVVFASKNRAVSNYWANPPFELLKEGFVLILNDTIRKKLYLFQIPAYAISESDLTPRKDKPELIDLQIRYDDSSFMDGRSKVKFLNFLRKSVDYE